MKNLLEYVEILLRDETINKIEIVKVEDSKVELWSGDGKYFGRVNVDY